MVTSNMIEAIDIIISLCSDKQQALGMISIREMLCDYEEGNYTTSTMQEKNEWLRGFMSC